MQENRPIAFTSKALSRKNLTLSTYEKEMLAIVHVLQDLIKDLRHDPQLHATYTFIDDELRYKGRLVLASTSPLKKEIMAEFHSSPIAGHSGSLKSYKRASRSFYWKGRLWIHAASKVPDPATIKAMEDFYKEIYAVNGITDLKFPEHYPVSRLLGSVEVVGCVKCEELVCWEEVPEGVRLEGQTNFCWLCEQPQKLLVPFEMRGYQGVYNLERRIYEAAVRGLCRVEGPLPVRFPLPDPRDPFSLKPGSLTSYFAGSKASEVNKPASLSAAIAGARAAATQFSKKEPNYQTNTMRRRDVLDSTKPNHLKNKSTEEDGRPAGDPDEWYGSLANNNKEKSTHMYCEGNSSSHYQASRRDLNQNSGPPYKLSEGRGLLIDSVEKQYKS
ncbi:hypothetical protein HHK36_026886 [Tetracentron sinense]|uniref:Integrase zinc-binding domain-containing protein n=1 Tax=Tetracentron sinense TaxID=13715 RepID=A0A834YHM3_TETSI|nr:hypothetical protein HHK36_026886 [Tetracentron sinense]